jgi:hypothetical protein
MTLGKRSLAFVLIVLYVGAVWVRVESLGESNYPYYKGESGTNFRLAQMIASDGRLPAIDQRDSRPEGYSPSRAKPTGVEYFTGYAYRLIRPFTDVSEKRFSGILAILVFSLSVFTMYALTHRVWDCQAAGGFAALLVAFSAPLIALTDGRDFLHAPYAFVVVSLHLVFFATTAVRFSVSRMVLTALVALALFGIWGSAGLYLAVFGVLVLLVPRLSTQTRRSVLASHLAATFVAGIVFPHLRAERFVFAWPMAWLLVATAYLFLRDKLPRRVPGWAYTLIAFAVLTLFFGLFRRGAGGSLDPLAYWYYRLRFIGEKPDDPVLLPGVVRLAWTGDHAPPSVLVLLEFFLPLLLLLPFAVGVFRGVQSEKQFSPWLYIVGVGLGTAVFLFDRGTVFSAALVAFPFVSGAFRGFGTHLKTRAAPTAVALALVGTSLPFAPAKFDVVTLLGERLGSVRLSSTGFVWTSIGNADRDLVRAIATKTSTRSDVILATPGTSSLIATFAGRSTVLVPGIYSREVAAKTVDALSGFYTGEDDFVERCETLGVTCVVYSIDMLLDESLYSPRYLSATAGDIENSLAYEMHFAPETLRHFELVYEDDNYRLFRVTKETKPAFLTDHPPVYQKEILGTVGGDLAAFYSRIIDILATYQTAVDAQTRNDEEGAIRRFSYCLDQAPSFTAARLGMGDSLMRLGKSEQAYEAYSRVLAYAPDNAHALYYGALSLAYRGRRSEALHLVDLLLTATAEQETRTEALDLKAALESGRPIEMPRRSSGDGSK